MSAPRKGRAPEPIPDVPGYDLKPDPSGARTAAALTDCLRAYRQWAGGPSCRAMAAACRQRVSYSTIAATLRSDAMPGAEALVAVIEGCGGSIADQERFINAWRRVIFTQANTGGDADAAS